MATPRPARLAPRRAALGLGLGLLGAGLLGHGDALAAAPVLLVAALLVQSRWPWPWARPLPRGGAGGGASPIDRTSSRAALHELNNALLAASATAELVARDLGDGAQAERARRLVEAVSRARSAAQRLAGSGEEPSRPGAPEPAGGAAVTPASGPGRAAVRRVLIADDDAAVCRILALGLERLGLSVETVGDGDGALERTRAGSFDAVVLDLNMPGRDGLEVAADLLGADPPWPGRVLLASGERIDPELRSRADALGCQLFPKPYTPTDLARFLGATGEPPGR